MIRKLIDYKKLDHDLTAKLIQTYSDGYGDEDIITFKNVRGEIIETVELKTEDAVYLVKISKSLAHFISNFDETMEKELDAKEEPIVEDEMGDSEMRLHSEEELSEDL
ncbi:hypothetical protein [Maribacter polysaccharolyticus]|uniref:hypothetical protein n=1 Tax=Maribacter polysaccharolyticus TaxID=3020831 RepID=UPI00237FB8C6|nr:hypothetical protein [Maribacter polysaccharolyticus]MDE3740369.1 hypothetical protein [Maribacter polysaccharolyticus]